MADRGCWARLSVNLDVGVKPVKTLMLPLLLLSLPLTGQAEFDAARAAFHQLAPGRPIDEIRRSPLPQLLEIRSGVRVLYLSEDGKFLLDGVLMDVRKGLNLTEQSRADYRRKRIEALPETDFIVFPAKREQYRVNVFTDVDCAFCRRMHSQIDAYNQLGVTVRYLAFPRSGLHTASFRKAVSVWCSKDPRAALTRAKQGVSIAPTVCDNPVASEYQLGKALGIRGTPALIAADGTLLSGYMPPQRLLQALSTRAGE